MLCVANQFRCADLLKFSDDGYACCVKLQPRFLAAITAIIKSIEVTLHEVWAGSRMHIALPLRECTTLVVSKRRVSKRGLGTPGSAAQKLIESWTMGVV